jgi:FkbM family methyltransferase
VVRGSRYEPRLRELKHLLEPADVRRGREEDARLKLLIAALVGNDSCCVDVGANVGDVLACMVAAAPAGRHIAYEPVPTLAAALRTRFPGVTVREAAVTRAAGVQEFTHVLDRASRSGLGSRASGGARTERLEVPVVALDDDLPDGFAPALIKVDVEGNEAHVIEGARQTIATHRPVLMFERGYADWSGTLFDTLDELAMLVFDFDGGGPYRREPFRAAVEQGKRVNFLARPAEGARE